MNNKMLFTHINFMRKPLEYKPLSNIDEREILIKDFIKKELKNEIK